MFTGIIAVGGLSLLLFIGYCLFAINPRDED